MELKYIYYIYQQKGKKLIKSTNISWKLYFAWQKLSHRMRTKKKTINSCEVCEYFKNNLFKDEYFV